ncbi:M48 family metalloprotease [Rubrivirga sp. S365]|uniref:M48 family metalloprotease n=1 Tax=Rubrivirga litoralis TaxID=3075598 RepID=A0ABU3BLN9_9BACT|nr:MULTISPECIES: M48 family metalloprotease [unclassified Rubrivirga]MDT0630178.1 M48 family metalloprotease [Rubrivirga sp. F394]MDT7855689.1 M48 family metalloprotease [Rubrivirga sp. S365]
MRPSRLRRLPRPALLLLVLLAGCGTANTNYVTGESQRGAYTWEQEVELGRQSDQQITAQFGLYDNPALNAYVERIGQEVLQTSAYTDANTPVEVRNTPFHFRVLDSPVVNAFALPGGYIYVTRGLLSHLENEAQLAVVLGHEIGHVLARHSSEQAARSQLNQLGLLGAAVVGGVVGGGDIAEGILNYGSQATQLLTLKYGRGAEREADRAGVAYAEYAGYDATQAAGFFRALQRLGEQSGGALPNFLSTHPNPGERAQTIPELAAQYDPQGTTVDAVPYLREIEGIVVGEDPRQGFVEGNTFYHPDLRFQLSFPSGWQTQNSPAAFLIGEPNGQALIQLSLAQEPSARAAAEAFARQQGVQVSGSGPVSVGAGQAFRVEGQAQQQQGAVGFSATFVEFGGNVYQILGITSPDGLRQYARTFRSVADSFERLTNQRYLNRQPSRLEVTTVQRPTTLRSMLRGRTLPPGFTAEEVAIMNQVTLDETIPSGRSVKLPS